MKNSVQHPKRDHQHSENGFSNLPEHRFQTFQDGEDSISKASIIKQQFSLLEMNPAFPVEENYQAIALEINWLLQILWFRYQNPYSKTDFTHFLNEEGYNQQIVTVPTLPQNSHYYKWLSSHDLVEALPVRLLFALLMGAQLNNALFFSLVELSHRPIITMAVGGKCMDQDRQFFPSLQTLFFLLGGIDNGLHMHYQNYFQAKAKTMNGWGVEFYSLSGKSALQPWQHLLIKLNQNIWKYLSGNAMPLPEDNQRLEITKLESNLTFDELILPPRTKALLAPLMTYAASGQAFFKNKALSKKFKPGYISLLYGPPGTGKTLIASTIGKHLGLTTYQLDVSKVVSKYIGETSQKINRVMDELARSIEWLEGKPSILFIDEADAFMGKRTEVQDSKDRYANLDVSNLLQKFEQFPGLVILASNYEQNFDDAFKRRFQSSVLIPAPEADERTLLWKMYLPQGLQYPGDNFARVVAENFALTGAQINNIMKDTTLAAYHEEATLLDFERHLEPNLKKELLKAGQQYRPPKDLMTKSQLDEAIYQQQTFWEAALPSKWQYMPLFLPRILSKAIILGNDDIQEIVKKARQKWEGGDFNHIPFKEGIDFFLRDLCKRKQLDWKTIQMNIAQLLKEEVPKKPPTEKEPLTKKPSETGKTIQLVPPDKLEALQQQGSSQTPKNSAKQNSNKENPARPPVVAPAPKVLQGFAAKRTWRELLPEGYQFEKDNMVNTLSITYGLTEAQIQQVIAKAVVFLDKMGGKALNVEVHIRLAIEAYCKEQKIDIKTLYTDRELNNIATKEAKLARKKRQRLNKNDTLTYWSNVLADEHYQYAQRGTHATLAQSYGPHSEEEIDRIIARAKAKAQAQQTNQISLGMIETCMQELGLMRRRY